MKKIILFTMVFISIFLVDTFAIPKERSILLDDVNTLNIKDKVKNIDFSEIKKICSYDFCDYIDGSFFKSSINTFTNKYLNTINDEEIKKELRVKGIKITKIILK